MANDIVIPRLGWSMEEGTFGEWLKHDGQTVEIGEPLFVLEGEKSAQDIESVDRGVLRIPANGPRPGDLVKVGQVIGFLTAPGESVPDLPLKSHPGPESHQNQPRAPAPTAVTAPQDMAPRAEVRSSPRARRTAGELGISVSSVTGGGQSGRVRERDVIAAAGGGVAMNRPASPNLAQALTGFRRTIAARMLESSTATAAVTLHRKCDAANLVNLRAQFRAGHPDQAPPSLTDLIVKLTGCVLVEFPEIRRQWHADQLVTPSAVDIAVAVETERGLLAPVLRGVDRMGLRQVSGQLSQLAAAARTGQLPAESLKGGVFTISNLGAFDVEWFTPIINLPQSAILGVGRIAREAVVRGEEIVIRDQVPLSLTFDHRVFDGAPAARFLQRLAQALENPGPHLLM